MNENDKPPINFTEPLYPSLKASAPIEEETPDFVKLLQTSRYNELKKQMEGLEELLRHYKKIKKKWVKIDSTVKILGISLATSVAIGAAILSPFNLVIVGSILSGVAASKVIITEGISVGYTSKKSKQYREICESINYC